MICTFIRLLVETNECDTAPCGAHGDCRDLLNAFACDCHTGYTGDLCNGKSIRIVVEMTHFLFATQYTLQALYCLIFNCEGDYVRKAIICWRAFICTLLQIFYIVHVHICTCTSSSPFHIQMQYKCESKKSTGEQ